MINGNGKLKNINLVKEGLMKLKKFEYNCSNTEFYCILDLIKQYNKKIKFICIKFQI